MRVFSVSEKVLLALTIAVLVACTVLAYMLGCMVYNSALIESSKTVTPEVKTDAISHLPKRSGEFPEYTNSDYHEYEDGSTPEEVTTVFFEENCPVCPDIKGCPMPAQKKTRYQRSVLPAKPMQTEWASVVSLNQPLYSDDPRDNNSIQFVCTGVIIGRKKVLTGKCVENADEFNGMIVRTNSMYWSSGGSLYKVIDHTSSRFPKSGLYLLTIDGNFKESSIIPLGQVGARWETAETIGWIRDPGTPLRKNLVEIERVTFKDLHCEGADCEEEHQVLCDDSDIGQPLISAKNLVGLISGSGCERNTVYNVHNHHYLDLTNPIYGRWLRELVEKQRRRW